MNESAMRPSARRAAILGLVVLPACAAAQELPGIGAPADSLHFAQSGAWQRWTLLGDLRVDGDFVGDLPGGREDLQRAGSFLRLGAALFPARQLELGGAFEAAVGSDDNADNRMNNDNETSDDFNLDLLYGRLRLDPHVEVLAGQAELPLALGAPVWDTDLRPAGGALSVRLPWRDFDAWRGAAGWFGVRSLAESWVRLAAAQVAYSYQDGAPKGADAALAFLHFVHADGLVADGLARTNATNGSVFVSDFDLLDIELAWRGRVRWLPWRILGGWIENLGAETNSTAWRGGLVLGDLVARRHIELRYLVHRIEQDAVLAAFNSDDWWFHSRMRGHRIALAVFLGRGTTAGISGSIERRDDLDTWTKRLRLDLRIALPGP